MGSELEGSGSGLTRRDALKRGAVAGGAVLWATPMVQSVAMRAAGAQTVSPVCVCTGTNSFDVTATFTGVVSGTVGPIQNFPQEPPPECLADLALTAPGGQNPFLRARVDCVGGSLAGGACSSFVELTDLAVDLGNVLPALDVELTASAVRADATCTCAGGCTASACVTDLTLTSGGIVVLNADGQVCNQPGSASISLPGVTFGSLEILQTSTNPCQATVLRLQLQLSLLGVNQTVDIIIARATAVCTPA